MTLIISTDGSNETNSGAISDAPAVQITGNNVTFTNATGGALSSTSAGQPAILITGANAHNINRGSIEAFAGHLVAILGSASDDRVDNYGRIYGHVQLGDGADIFNQYFAAAGIGIGNVSMGAGSDTYNLLVDPGFPLNGFVDGGAGEDYLNLLASISQVSGFVGFEHLTVGANVTNLQGFSNLLSLTLTPGGFNNFIYSFNPTLDVTLQNNFFSVGPGSSFRNVIGGDAIDSLTLNSSSAGNSTLTGSASLGGGADQVTINVFDATSANPIISGTIDGGLGIDNIWIITRSSQAVDLTNFINFESLVLSTQSISPVVGRAINANGLLEIRGNASDIVSLGQSNSPNAQLWGGFGGRFTIESTSVIGHVGQALGSAYNPYNLAEIEIGDSAYNLNIVNNGTLLGGVQLYIGDDVYDGSLGSTGGTIYGYAGNDRLTGGAGAERIEGGFGNDVIVGNGGSDILFGGAGNDIITGGSDASSLDGGDGNDQFTLGIGASGSRVDGGSGIDMLRITDSVNWLADLVSIDSIWLIGGASLTLSGSQFANGIVRDPSSTVGGRGRVLGAGTLIVNMEAGINYDAADFLFSDITMIVNGTSGADIINCGGTSHIVNAGDGNDYINAYDGGTTDQFFAGAGDDAITFGWWLNAADIVDGGSGNDQVAISGNYAGAFALVLDATTLTNVEVLAALPGGSYEITLNDGNTAAGATFTVFGGNLGFDDDFTVNASAETNGNIITYGGLGINTITGGAGNDGFYFGPAKYGPTDRVTGGAGSNDQLALDGDYTLTITSREDVEVLALLRGPVGTPNTFNITVDNTFTPIGQTRIIWGAQLLTSLTLDASTETNGNLIFFGGTQSDTLTGGRGNDTISGGGGGDALRGGLGNDIFRYSDLSDSNGSTNATRDRILDFASGDRIDLSGIDAITGGGNDAFAFIGSGAFTNVAGQLRSIDNGNGTFTIEGDVNGDGLADLAILVTSATPLGAGDFVL